MVSFRLLPEEYQTFSDACEPHGARSISELARTALQMLVVPKATETPVAVPIEQQISDLRERVALISQELERLATRVNSVI